MTSIAASVRVATGVSEVPWVLHMVDNGLIQARFQVIALPLCALCGRQRVQAPSSFGQRGLHADGAIAAR